MLRALLPAVLLLAAPTYAAPVRTPHVEAELVAERTAIAPGEPLTVALRLKMISEWHTYWRNPGDSGEPTRLAWQLPPGFAASEIHWPYPRRLPAGPLMNYGYEDEVLLLARITPPRDLAPGTPVTLDRKGELARVQPRALHSGGRRAVAHAAGRSGCGRGSALGEADRRRAGRAACATGSARRLDARRPRRGRRRHAHGGPASGNRAARARLLPVRTGQDRAGRTAAVRAARRTATGSSSQPRRSRSASHAPRRRARVAGRVQCRDPHARGDDRRPDRRRSDVRTRPADRRASCRPRARARASSSRSSAASRST